jgi:predicted nucleic acid-binding protein
VPFVLDASVVASWHFPDEKNPDTDLVLDQLRLDRALVPQHWWFEIRNVLLLGERRGRSAHEETTTFLDRLSRLRITAAPLPIDTNVLALARRHRLTFYDATYLELAQHENLPLATLDNELAAAAKAEQVELIISYT